MKKILAQLIRVLVLGLAAIFLIYTVKKYGGFAVVGGYLRDLGGFSVLVLINSLGWMVFYTRAWSRLFVDFAGRVPFLPLLRVKIAGEAVNLATPAGFAGGDPVRMLLLRGSFGAANRLRSVVVDRVMHIFATFIFCVLGTSLLFFQPVILPSWLFWTGVGGLAFYIVMTILAGYLLLRLLRGGGLGFVDVILHRTGLGQRFPKIGIFIETLRSDLQPYQGRPRAPMIEAFTWHFAGRILGAVENMIIMYALLGEVHFLLAIILASFTSFFLLVFGFVPGGIGVIEEMYAAFFRVFGADPAIGFSAQVIRRLRAVFWVMVGIFLIDLRELMRLRAEHH